MKLGAAVCAEPERAPLFMENGGPAVGGQGLAVYSRVTAASAFGLLIAGGLVTSTGSGLAVPDWPLSFGKFFPPMRGGVLFEHGHRMVAGVVSLLTLGLTVWIAKADRRLWVRRLTQAALAAIAAQAVLGGMTVLLKLPPPVSIAHACLGQAVFCALLLVADAYRAGAQAPARYSWKAGAVAAASVYVQLLLGAVFRHTGRGLMLHIGWALVATAALSWAAARSWRAGGPARLIALLLPIQLLLGLAAYLIRTSPFLAMDFHAAAALTTAHVGVGAALLGSAVVLSARGARS